MVPLQLQLLQSGSVHQQGLRSGRGRQRALTNAQSPKRGNAPHIPTSGNSSFSGSQMRRFRNPWDSTIAELSGSEAAVSLGDGPGVLEESSVSRQFAGGLVRSAAAWVSHLVVWLRRPATGGVEASLPTGL